MPVTLDAIVMFLGWIGAAAGVVAYAMVSRGRWAPSSAPFQLTNLTAAGLMGMVAAANGVWPSVAANLVWVLIGAQAIAARGRAPGARGRRRAAAAGPPAPAAAPAAVRADGDPAPQEVGLAA